MRPKAPPVWLLVLGALVPLAVGAAFYAFASWNDVDVVNGLAVPVKVTIDGATQTVPSFGRVRFSSVRTGTQLLEASTEAGVAVESRLAVIEGHRDTVVYNVAGAAPVVWERIEYSSAVSANNRRPNFTVLCGQSLIHYASIDYPFTEPPRSMSVKGGGTVYKTRLALESGGLKACESFAMQEGKSQLLPAWQALEARLSPPKSPEEQVGNLLQRGEDLAALAAADAALASSDALELHRTRQDLMVLGGQREEALSQYRARAQRPGATAQDAYLFARMLPLEERLKVQAQALLQSPDDGWLLWAHANALKVAGEWAKALALYGRVAAQDEGMRVSILNGKVEALLHLGRLKEARALADDFKPAEGRDLDVLHLRADLKLLVEADAQKRLNVLTGGVVGGLGAIGAQKLGPNAWKTRWVQALTEERETPRKTSVKGKPADDDVDLPVLAAARGVVRAAYSNPGAALGLVGSADLGVLQQLPDSITLLLLAEAWRAGNGPAAGKLAPRSGGINGAPLVDIQRFLLDGTLGEDLPFIGDEELASLWFARGRRLQGAGEPAEEAFKRAAALDVLHRTATRAMAKWPPLNPSSTAKSVVPWAAVD